MRELAYLNGLEEGTSAVAAPVATMIASPVVRGRGRGRGIVRGVVRSSVTHAIPRPAVVATVTTPRHASTAPETYVRNFTLNLCLAGEFMGVINNPMYCCQLCFYLELLEIL